MGERPVARVLLQAPLPQLDRLLDYAIPAELLDEARPGVRVRVPLRGAGRMLEGYIVERGVAVEPDRPLSDLDAVLSPAAVLPQALYRHARRVADRAAGSAADILRLVIPKRQLRIEKAWAARDEETPDEEGSPQASEVAGALLAGFPGLADALDGAGRIALDAPPRPATLESGRTVGDWARLLAAAAATTRARGRSVIIAVPDHRDLEQVTAALAETAPDAEILRDDSGRSAAERSRNYLRMLEERACIVVGNRSAVYAPVHDLGLLAIWDDGDSLFDEPLAPYVHARDAALVRQEIDGCALVFAGHTRTTEVERLVGLGWVRAISASRRVTPRVVLGAEQGPDPSGRISSAAFRAAGDALQTGPVLVQVARPGYAPVLACAQCRRPARCAHCGGPLAARARGTTPDCRWCGRSAHHWRCPHCDGESFRFISSGSRRTADELGRAFPGVRVIIADGDHQILRVDDRPALVVATRGAEPIADGGYRAVLLLDGDRMLLAESLRIGENCLRWWSNAAALAAPGAPVHLVGVAGRVARALATWSQPAYARSELEERAPLHLPPVVRVALLEGAADVLEQALADVQLAAPQLPAEAVLGPVVATNPPGAPTGDDPTIYRALVRFEYSLGPAIMGALRAAVIAAALRSRRRSARAPARNTLRVRADVPEPEL